VKRKFIVTASDGRGGGLSCGEFEAESPIDAIVQAKETKGEWAATNLGVELWKLAWEAEEDFI
jgi:hypothetical protein